MNGARCGQKRAYGCLLAVLPDAMLPWEKHRAYSVIIFHGYVLILYA